MKHSITRRLFGSVLALILPLLLLQGFILWWSSSMITDEVCDTAERNVQYLRQYLEVRVQNVLDASASQLSDDQTENSVGQFYARLVHDSFESTADYYMQLRDLRNTVRAMKYTSDLVKDVQLVFPRENLTVCPTTVSAVDPELLDKLLSARDEQPAGLMQAGDTLYSVYGWSKADNLRGANILMCVELEKEALEKMLDAYSKPSSCDSYLVSAATGSILVSCGEKTVTREQLAPLLGNLQRDTAVRTRFRAGDTDYEAFVGYSPTLEAAVIQLMPRSLFNRVPTTVGLLIAVLCVATVLVLANLLAILHRNVGRPVRGLQEAFQRAGKGDFSLRLPVQPLREFDLLAQGFNTMSGHIDSLIDTNYRQTIRLQAAELKRLQAQINPHFLYNSFYFLRYLISEEETESAEEFCRYLGNYFQYITRSDENTLPLEAEVRHARDYLAVQLMRFGDTVEAELDELPEDMKQIRVPRLIVEPVVENCFKYGMNTTESRGRIRLRYEEDGQTVSVIVENNGNDLTDEAIDRLRQLIARPSDEASFTGLVNTHHRLKLFFGDAAGVEVGRSELGGLAVRLRLGRQPRDGAQERSAV